MIGLVAAACEVTTEETEFTTTASLTVGIAPPAEVVATIFAANKPSFISRQCVAILWTDCA